MTAPKAPVTEGAESVFRAHPAEQGDGVREAADVEGLAALTKRLLHGIEVAQGDNEFRQKMPATETLLIDCLAALRSLTETNRVQRLEIAALWKLLDDIDTLDDECRGDDARFRSEAYIIQRKRFAIVSGERIDAIRDELVDQVSADLTGAPMTSESVAQLPCPFCGARATNALPNQTTGSWWISCTRCDAEMSDGSKERVVAAWNTRALLPGSATDGAWFTPWADLQTVIARLDPDFPNYADWPITLPAGHWRALALTTPPLVDSSLRDGWVLVPREPTEAMIEAACVAAWPLSEFVTGSLTNGERQSAAYRAMIAAAPSPRSGEDESAPSEVKG